MDNAFTLNELGQTIGFIGLFGFSVAAIIARLYSKTSFDKVISSIYVSMCVMTYVSLGTTLIIVPLIITTYLMFFILCRYL